MHRFEATAILLEATFSTDLRERPSYPLTEAARFIKLPAATLKSWVQGRSYPKTTGRGRSHPLIRPALQAPPPMLSFNNLIEAHVLRALRLDHAVSLDAVRKALEYAQAELNIDRLLLREDLRAGAGELFLDRYGHLLNLSRSGQLAMREVFEQHLKRVEWDSASLPIRLYPFLSAISNTPDRPIAIDPRIAFGRPVIARSGISTRVIAERIDAGEELGAVTADYEITDDEVRQAVLYEHAA